MRPFLTLACTLFTACAATPDLTDSDRSGTPDQADNAIVSTSSDALPNGDVQTDVIHSLSQWNPDPGQDDSTADDVVDAPDWWSADLPEGWYDVQLLDMMDDGCALDLPETYEVQLEQSAEGPMLWGFAPILTDGAVLSVAGQGRWPDGDCTEADIREGLGTQVAADAFELEVHQAVHTTGADCPVTSCMTTFRARYEWVAPPE